MSAPTRPVRSATDMVSAPTDFHGMEGQQPIELSLLLIQSAAARSALDYLVGEKLRMFEDAATHDAAFARELPRFLAATFRVFNEYELAGYVAMQKPAVRRRLRTLLYFS